MNARPAFILLVLCCLAVPLLAGCAGRTGDVRPSKGGPSDSASQAGQGGQFSQPVPSGPSGKLPGTARPYTINGQLYRPLLTADGYREEGVASWYGPGFHGKATSCGEPYDMFKITAAHKILPMHTLVRVTNQENGRTLTVRVNDRGPFVSGRIIDLSYSAACMLGMDKKGTSRVLVESLGPVPGARDGDLPGVFYVQVGAFTMRENADALVAALRSQGYASSRVVQSLIDGRMFWRVQAGSFGGLLQAREAHGSLVRPYPQAFVVAE